MSIDTKTELPLTADASVPGEKAAPKIHLGYLDSLRALAAIYVVAFHGLSDIDPKYMSLSGHLLWLRLFFSYGHYAVDLFIVLSGFCLMLPVVRSNGTLKGGAIHFFKKRAMRILPPYYLALAFSLLLIQVFIGHKTGTLWDLSVPVTRMGLLTHLFLIQDAFRSTVEQINHSLWSVSVEWRIYFAFPLIVFLWRKIGPIPVTAVSVITGYVLLFLLRHTPVYTYTSGVSPQYLGLFALGVLGSGVTFSQDGALFQLRERVPWMLSTALLLVTVIILSTVRVFHGKLLEISVLDFFVGLLAMSLLIAAGRDVSNWLHRALSWKPLAFLGTFAYSIYLVHAPILQMIYQYLQVPFHFKGASAFAVECLLVVPVTVALAYVFFLACERPFLSRRVVLNTK